ncbi:M20 family metallo-hydrolase [candidate division KSB1 bacterium]|nr:M20 family metallo-hydrolase [candidate division KSB1 bacterium]
MEPSLSPTLQSLLQKIDGYHDEAIELQKQMTAIPALSPENGGDGEKIKSDFLREWVERELRPDDLQEFHAPDSRVSCGYRPNLVATFNGRSSAKTIWIMSHMDVVPPGDLSKWTGDPWVVRVEKTKDGRTKLIGRGVEDNQQGLASSVFAVKALRDLNITPEHNVGIVLVADEETGSHYGIDYLLKQHKDLFAPHDLIIIPDAGDSKGKMIEVAEKSIVWLKFHTRGVQTHGSVPEKGRNAHKAASFMVTRMETLYKKFPRRNALFHPPISTFEPTKREANVPNVNTIPGEDVLYFDCRVLPDYKVSEVMKAIRAITREIEKQFKVKITVSPQQVNEQAAPPTAPDAPVVLAIAKAMRELRRVRTQAVGIGGGTVAAFFRRAGIPAAVWSTMEDTAHSPDEFALVEHLLNDAKVFGHVVMQEG